MSPTQSINAFHQAQKIFPGGVNSPVRAFKGVGGTPIFMQKAKGAYLYSEEGIRYIDYVSSWGAIIIGHAPQKVVADLQKQITLGTSYGTPTILETQLALHVQSMVPNIAMLRMVNSGTEACMSAVRLARGYTQKKKVLKFEGNYHGHADTFLVKAGSGLATLSIDTASGVPSEISTTTLVCPYNNIAVFEKIIAQEGKDIACVIVEPVAGNMGCIPPHPDFLPTLRKRCTEHNIVLIFDEVMTGFRLATGGAQSLFHIDADLVCFGKVIGGGMPIGAFGGKKKIMQHIAPLGKVYQAGTLSGNPIAMRSGLSVLEYLSHHTNIYDSLNQKAQHLQTELRNMFKKANIPVCIQQVGSMLSVFFTEAEKVTNFEEVQRCDTERFARFFHSMLIGGIYLPPSAFESWFLNDALSEADIQHTLQQAHNAIQKL